MHGAGVTAGVRLRHARSPRSDPWAAVRAAVHHHDPDAAARPSRDRVRRRTPGRLAAAGVDDAGVLAPARRRPRRLGRRRPARRPADPDAGLPRPACAPSSPAAPSARSTSEHSTVDAPRASSTSPRPPASSTSTRPPSARRGALAAQGRAADRRAGPKRTPPCRSSGPTLRLAGLGRRRPRRHPVGQPARSTPSAADVGLEHGVAAAGLGRAASAARPTTWPTLAQKAAAGSVALPAARGPRRRPAPARRRARPVGAGITRIDAPPPRARAADQDGTATPARKPWIYLIVATGDIYEDIPQAQAAAREGADVIAVIRSTGQSPARLRARGRDPRGLRRHLRHAGELPADAGRARRVEHASSAATSG